MLRTADMTTSQGVKRDMAIVLMAFIFVHWCLAVVPATAAEPGTPIALRHAVERGLQDNHGIQAARLGTEEARHALRGSYDGFMPRLRFDQSFMYSDNPVNVFATKLNQAGFGQQDFSVNALNYPDHIDDHSSLFTVEIPIFNGGAEYLGVKMAKTGQQKAAQMLESAEEEIVYRITEAFYGAALARDGLRLAEDAVKVAEDSLALIQSRFDEGLVFKSDLLSAKLHVTQLKEQREKARNQLRIARLGFNLLLGDIDGSYVPDGQIVFVNCPNVAPGELSDLATTRRPELRIKEADLAMAEKELAMARTKLMPTLNAQGTYEFHGESPFSDGADATTVAVGLRVPLFQGMGVYTNLDQSRAKIKRLKAEIAQLKEQIRLEVAEAISRIDEAETRIDLSEQTVAQAVETNRLVMARYEEGAATIVELQQAELGISQSRMRRLQALFDHLLAQARLCRATGQSRRALEPQMTEAD